YRYIVTYLNSDDFLSSFLPDIQVQNIEEMKESEKKKAELLEKLIKKETLEQFKQKIKNDPTLDAEIKKIKNSEETQIMECYARYNGHVMLNKLLNTLKTENIHFSGIDSDKINIMFDESCQNIQSLSDAKKNINKLSVLRSSRDQVMASRFLEKKGKGIFGSVGLANATGIRKNILNKNIGEPLLLFFIDQPSLSPASFLPKPPPGIATLFYWAINKMSVNSKKMLEEARSGKIKGLIVINGDQPDEKIIQCILDKVKEYQNYPSIDFTKEIQVLEKIKILQKAFFDCSLVCQVQNPKKEINNLKKLLDEINHQPINHEKCDQLKNQLTMTLQALTLSNSDVCVISDVEAIYKKFLETCYPQKTLEGRSRVCDFKLGMS
ncbi:MAG: hypothetical protein JO131_02390, partial [Gammaproteobacteria bacterium]|nr:hypothetical protein [Gammaproteobacteria bacterium]